MPGCGRRGRIHLDIGENNLSQIEPELVAKAVNMLKVAHLSLCQLTSKQVDYIFKQASKGETKTTFLNIESNITGKLSAEVIAEVEKKMTILFLRTKRQRNPKLMCRLCGKGPFLRLRLHKCKK